MYSHQGYRLNFHARWTVAQSLDELDVREELKLLAHLLASPPPAFPHCAPGESGMLPTHHADIAPVGLAPACVHLRSLMPFSFVLWQPPWHLLGQSQAQPTAPLLQ